MAIAVALDVGTKRTGIAITDSLGLIATALTTVKTEQLMPYLKNLFLKENIHHVVLGLPIGLDGKETDATLLVNKIAETIQADYPDKDYYFVDERFTSKIAQQTILQSGKSKKQRRNKELTDKVSAVLILQSWIDRQQL